MKPLMIKWFMELFFPDLGQGCFIKCISGTIY